MLGAAFGRVAKHDGGEVLSKPLSSAMLKSVGSHRSHSTMFNLIYSVPKLVPFDGAHHNNKENVLKLSPGGPQCPMWKTAISSPRRAKKQAKASRLQPPALAKLSAFGWSGSTRFGARLRTKALIWGNRGLGALTRMHADLAAPITRHRHYQSPFRCTIHYPCSTNQLI